MDRVERLRPPAPQAPPVLLPIPEPGRVQEFYADTDDAASAMGLAVMLTAGSEGTLVWLRDRRAEARTGPLHGPGLAQLGLSPERLLCAVVPDSDALLQAAADALRCAGLSAVVVESWGPLPRLDLTASRRLVLAAEKSGTPALLLRLEAAPVPSAAHSRWQVASAASRPLAPNAPGHSSLELTLLRRRGAPAGQQVTLEWNADARAFTAIPGPAVPVAADRTVARHTGSAFA